MFCQKCGNEIKGNERFCTQCGASVPRETEQKKNSSYLGVGVLAGLAIPAVIAILILIVLIPIFAFFIGRKIISSKKPDPNANQVVKEVEEKEDEEEKEEKEEEEKEEEEGEYISYSDSDPQYPGTYGDFVIPDSSYRYISDYDLYGLSAEECRIARNEIYARHGRMFKDQSLQSYFNSKSWYIPTVPADDFKESMLNEYERKNKDVIVQYEKSQGYQ